MSTFDFIISPLLDIVNKKVPQTERLIVKYYSLRNRKSLEITEFFSKIKTFFFGGEGEI